MLCAVLRKNLWHQLSSLVFAHDIGDLLPALPWSSTVQGRQCVLPNDLTAGHKVTAWDLRCTINTARFSLSSRREFSSFLPLHISEVTAAGWIIWSDGIYSSYALHHSCSFNHGGLHSSLPPFPEWTSDNGLRHAMLPPAMVTPRQGVLPPEFWVSPHILVMIRQLRPPLPALEAKREHEERWMNLFFYHRERNKIITHILHTRETFSNTGKWFTKPAEMVGCLEATLCCLVFFIARTWTILNMPTSLSNKSAGNNKDGLIGLLNSAVFLPGKQTRTQTLVFVQNDK